jgi:hypothetical protein
MHLSESGSPDVSAKYECPRPLVKTERCNALRGSSIFAPAPLRRFSTFYFRRYLGPRSGMRSVRFILVVASMLALGPVCLSVVLVVVVAVSVVVVHPTIATIHTPKTSGINFFINAVLSEWLHVVTR